MKGLRRKRGSMSHPGFASPLTGAKAPAGRPAGSLLDEFVDGPPVAPVQVTHADSNEDVSKKVRGVTARLEQLAKSQGTTNKLGHETAELARDLKQREQELLDKRHELTALEREEREMFDNLTPKEVEDLLAKMEPDIRAEARERFDRYLSKDGIRRLSTTPPGDEENRWRKHAPVGWKEGFAGLCDGWTDADLMRLGMEQWRKARSFFDSKKDDRDFQRVLEERGQVALAQDIVMQWASDLYQDGGADDAKRYTAMSFVVFAVAWAEHAFQKLQTTHTYAAALMCSDASREVLEDLHVPWHAFMVHVPNGLLAMVLEDGTTVVDFTRVLVVVDAEDGGSGYRSFLTLYDPASREFAGKGVTHRGKNLADLLFAPTPEDFVGNGGGRHLPKITRAIVLAKRLVAGLILAMQTQDNLRTRETRAWKGNGPGREGEPTHRTTIVGRPLRVDCREHVREYMGGGTSAPRSVQTLVTGHHKRQVIGVGRTGRKVVWIEPYWRGPEDAPILTRPKLVDPRKEKKGK